MKTTCKIFLLLSILLCFVSMDAQAKKRTGRAGRRVVADLRFGLNFPDLDIKNGNHYKETKLEFHIESLVAYKFAGDFLIQSGLTIVKKGVKQKQYTFERQSLESGYLVDKRTNINLAYAQFPVKLGYEHYFTDNFAFNIAAGGYLAYGFKGHSKVEGSKTADQTGFVEEIYDTGKLRSFKPNRFKRFDYGIIGTIGLVYDIYSFGISYDIGLANISDRPKDEVKNRNLYISLGFRF